MKICETSKLKNGQKYCLAFHPSPRYLDFQEMGGVHLKDLKRHTNAMGGAWGDDTWAALVKESCDGILDNTEDIAASLEETKAKRALLIPINAFSSTQIMKIASLTGQSEDYKKFGADEETPSGVEVDDVRVEEDDVRNSTHQAGSSQNLVLNDLSSVRSSKDNISFDELVNTEEHYIFQENETEENET